MTGVRRFEDLACWQEARELARNIERWLTSARISDASYVDQLRRASTSVQANIAEGFDRYTHREFHRYLSIAKGSLAEVRALLIAAFDRGILDPGTYDPLTSQAELLARRISHLMLYLRRSKPR